MTPDEMRPKCAQCGAFSQMGPQTRGADGAMKVAGDFWTEAAPKAHLYWERHQTKDRYCAIHLVKRFAWAACDRRHSAAPAITFLEIAS